MSHDAKKEPGAVPTTPGLNSNVPANTLTLSSTSHSSKGKRKTESFSSSKASTPIYRIKDWAKHFENAQSRKYEKLSWIPVPNKHDGEGYSRVMAQPQAAEIFAAWVLMLQVASKCTPRGSLSRSDGSALGADSLAVKTRSKKEWFEAALKFLSSPEVGWIEQVGVDKNTPLSEETNETGSALGAGSHSTTTPFHSSGSEQNRTEQNGIEHNNIVELPEATELHLGEKPSSPTPGESTRKFKRTKTKELAKSVLAHLNSTAGRNFRETDENLDLIACRLEEVELDTAGVEKMIERQVAKWKGDEKMEEYLRPQTLFNKSKFSSYYDMRDLPVQGKSEQRLDTDYNKEF
jgi:uncharacterized phage protein (TIGR02220 family)